MDVPELDPLPIAELNNLRQFHVYGKQAAMDKAAAKGLEREILGRLPGCEAFVRRSRQAGDLAALGEAGCSRQDYGFAKRYLLP